MNAEELESYLRSLEKPQQEHMMEEEPSSRFNGGFPIHVFLQNWFNSDRTREVWFYIKDESIYDYSRDVIPELNLKFSVVYLAKTGINQYSIGKDSYDKAYKINTSKKELNDIRTN